MHVRSSAYRSHGPKAAGVWVPDAGPVRIPTATAS